MKVSYKKSFLKSLQKLKEAEIKEAIFDVIVHAENADAISQIRNIKKT